MALQGVDVRNSWRKSPLRPSPAPIWRIHGGDRTACAATAISLGNLAAIEAVGPLAKALTDSSTALRQEAGNALKQLLPFMGPEHRGLLGLHSEKYLASAVNSQDPQLAYAVIAALYSIGAGPSIPYVEKAVRSARTVRMRDEGSRLLEVLKARVNEETKRDLLLRPAEKQDDSLLLRPYNGG